MFIKGGDLAQSDWPTLQEDARTNWLVLASYEDCKAAWSVSAHSQCPHTRGLANYNTLRPWHTWVRVWASLGPWTQPLFDQREEHCYWLLHSLHGRQGESNRFCRGGVNLFVGFLVVENVISDSASAMPRGKRRRTHGKVHVGITEGVVLDLWGGVSF